jgi:hypothetical protein
MSEGIREQAKRQLSMSRFEDCFFPLGMMSGQKNRSVHWETVDGIIEKVAS